jgi:hypothetical protein
MEFLYRPGIRPTRRHCRTTPSLVACFSDEIGVTHVLRYTSPSLNLSTMSNLEYPDTSASTADWRAWLEELQDMRQTAEVKYAIRQAEQLLKSRRSTDKRSARKPRDRYELEAA